MFEYATASRRPLKLIFCEYFYSKKDALRREAYFKTTAGKKALKLMLRESLKEVEEESLEPKEMIRNSI